MPKMSFRRRTTGGTAKITPHSRYSLVISPSAAEERPVYKSTSSAEERPVYKVGDLVLAKMRGFPYWPGIIQEPTEQLKKISKAKQSQYCVYFFGSRNYAWVDWDMLKLYDSKDKIVGGSALSKAILEIEDYKKGVRNIVNPDKDAFDQLFAPSEKEKELKKTDSVGVGKRKPVNKENLQSSKVRKRSSSTSRVSEVLFSPKNQKTNKRTNSSNSGTSTSPVSAGPVAGLSPPTTSNVKKLFDNDAVTSVERPQSPTLDFSDVTVTELNEDIIPSKMQFGFLGLGMMGIPIVKNLLRSGHKVMIYNESQDVCEKLEEDGAKLSSYVNDVVSASDVIFTNFLDEDEVNRVVYGVKDVLEEINPNKGFIDISHIDAKSSKSIAEAVYSAGGRYLEARFLGAYQNAEERTVVTLAGGDRSLYQDCMSCFKACGSKTLFMGDVGNAANVAIVKRMFSGLLQLGLLERFALAKQCDLDYSLLKKMYCANGFDCLLVTESFKDGKTPYLPISDIKHDLHQALKMNDNNSDLILNTAGSAYEWSKELLEHPIL